jgi:hypothetical protein
MTKSFEKLKHCFITVPILTHFDPHRKCIVETDALDFALGGTLSQTTEDKKLHPNAFHSRIFSLAKINYKIQGFCTTHGNGDPPPAFATTSNETIEFSIGFGFAVLIYVSLWISREFYIDSVDFRREIRVFMCFGLPYLTKCHQNIANTAPHHPNRLDLPHDGSDPFADGTDGNVDRTDERSAVNVPQCTSATEIIAAASPDQTPTRDPLLRIWHHELIAAMVDTIVHEAPLDCSPKVIYHYSAASLCTIEQAHIETQLCLTEFEDNVYNNFDKLLHKMDAA